jgi:sulfatase maturation enzyme AslB (radical SAM superfamily)
MSTRNTETIKVYFEVTNHCNFRCDFCPIGESQRPRQHMDWELLVKGIDEVARSGIAEAVGFHILGEPLLYPRITDAVRYAAERGLRTEINTNGSLLTPERVDALLAAGLNQLAISVQILDPAAHASRGSALSFEVYYRRVMDAVRHIATSGGSTEVTLCAMNTATRRYFDVDRPLAGNGTTSEFRRRLTPFFMDIFTAIGQPADAGRVQSSVRWMNVTNPKIVKVSERVKVYVQSYADWGNAFTRRRIFPATIGYCGYALTNVGVLSNGEVTICCADYDGKTSLGNLRTASLPDLLASRRAQAIRDGFEQMRVTHPHCQRCIGATSSVTALFKGLVSIYLFRLLAFQPARVREVALLPAR